MYNFNVVYRWHSQQMTTIAFRVWGGGGICFLRVILHTFFPGCQQNSINSFKVKTLIPSGRPAVTFKENSRREGVFIVIPEQLISVSSLLVAYKTKYSGKCSFRSWIQRTVNFWLSGSTSFFVVPDPNLALRTLNFLMHWKSIRRLKSNFSYFQNLLNLEDLLTIRSYTTTGLKTREMGGY